MKNIIKVWLDIDVNKAMLTGILFENSDDYSLYIQDGTLPSGIINNTNNEGFVFQSDLYLNLCVDNLSIIVTEKNMENLINYDEVCNVVVVSVFHLDLSEYRERILSQVIYSSALYFNDWNKNQLSNPEAVISWAKKSNKKHILGKMEFNEPPSSVHTIITHGIRTHADEWVEEASIILGNKNIDSSIFRYDWVDVLKFALNVKIRKKYAEIFLKKINLAQQENPHKRLSIVAHSFGSIVLSTALELAEQIECRIKIDAIILNGSILPSTFNWQQYSRENKSFGVSINRVLNLCGDNDVWPVVAKHWTRKAGYSGTFFFSDNNTKTMKNIRLKGTDHSSILSVENVENIWAKYLYSKSYKPEASAVKVASWPKIFDYLSRFIKILSKVLLGPILLLIIFIYF